MSTSVASAYWPGAGQGSGLATLTTLPAPTISSATAGAEAVELSWSSVTAPGAGPVEYYVTRDGGAPAGNCPTASAPSTVTSCTDTGVPIGTHKYVVKAVWRSWSAASAEQSATVSFGAATHFVLEAATASPTAGEADNLTITAKDASNNTVRAYTGTHALLFEGASESSSGSQPVVIDKSGTSRPFGEATEINFTEGKATAGSSKNGVMKLYKAETAHIVVKEGSLTSGTGLAVTVKPAATTKLGFSAPTEATAGSSFNVTLTAADQYGNTTTGYSGAKTLTWSGPGNSPSGHAPEYPSTATSVTFASGSGKASGLKLFNAASTTLTVKEGASVEGSSGAFNVKAGAYKRIGWTGTRTEPAGKITSATCLFECTAEGLGSDGKFFFKVAFTDEWGNLQSSHGTGSKTVKLTDACSGCSLSASTLSIAEGATSSSEATLTGATNTSWQGTLEASESTLKATATASLKH